MIFSVYLSSLNGCILVGLISKNNIQINSLIISIAHPELQAQCLGIIARNADAKSAELTLQALSSNEKVLQQAAVRALQFHLPIPSSYLPRIVQVGDIDDVCDLLALTGCEGVEDWAVNAVASHLDRM